MKLLHNKNNLEIQHSGRETSGLAGVNNNI